MALFPFPLGGSSFEEMDRYERSTRAVNRLTGEGGFTDAEDSVFRRGLKVFAELCAGVSLATSRLKENIFPDAAHPEDLLPRHESWLRIVLNPLSTVEQRWATLKKKKSDRGGARIIDIKKKLEEVVGAGNVVPKFNTAADLDANGHSRVFMFALAYEIPVALISTLGQIAALDELINLYKPITCGAVVTREVAHGFLTDDDLSLTDRDVLDS